MKREAQRLIQEGRAYVNAVKVEVKNIKVEFAQKIKDLKAEMKELKTQFNAEDLSALDKKARVARKKE